MLFPGRNILTASKRAKRKKFFLRLFFVFLFLLLAAVGGIIGLFQIDGLKIKSVSITGNSFLSEQELLSQVNSVMDEKVFGLIPKDRIFFFLDAEVTANLFEKFGRLAKVKIEKKYPSFVSIEVQERMPIAVLCEKSGKTCFFLDETGFIFEKAPFFSAGVYLKFFDERQVELEEGRFLLPREIFGRLLVFKERLENISKPLEIYLKGDGVYEIHTEAGWYLIIDEKDDWDAVYNNFVSFYGEIMKSRNKKDIDYIDLRFGNKVFYK